MRLRQRGDQERGLPHEGGGDGLEVTCDGGRALAKVNASDLLPLARDGVRFSDGVQEKPKSGQGPH
jgi:hypothetical protein